MGTATDAAQGRWPEILRELGGLTDKQLTDNHQPCPICGGKDRYRFDDRDGSGSYFCNNCGAGNGMSMLQKKNGWDFKQTATAVERFLGVSHDTKEPPHHGPPVRHPAMVWSYSATFAVVRRDLPNGDKEVRPWCYFDGKWQRKLSDALKKNNSRPLLYSHELERRPEAAVIVVEGEKTCDAAKRLFPRACVTTWSGGAKGIGKTNFDQLKGRKVILWPDNDEEGRAAMERLAKVLNTLTPRPAALRLVSNPSEAPEKWDVADSGWSVDEANTYLRQNFQDLAIEAQVQQVLQPLAKSDLVDQGDQGVQEDVQVATVPTMVQYGSRELLQHFQSPQLRFNTFTNQIEQDGEVLRNTELTYLKLAEQNIKVGKDLAADCLIQAARANSYDPVREYLEHVEATAEPAFIERLATTYLRPEDADQPEPTLYDEMLMRTLIGAVKRVFEPGAKHDTATVLMGAQGCRKSTFWSTLGGPFFSDALRDIQSKDDLQILHRSWITEWAELDAITSKKHAGSVKAFLSQSVDIFRVPYGRATEDFPRRCIIVGTTNRKSGFLVDETGNRRFWVIPTEKTMRDHIDIDGLKIERDSIWAAAVKKYREGVTNYLPEGLADAASLENEEFLIESPWADAIETWLQQPRPHQKITTAMILSEAILKPIERQTKQDQMHVSDVMRRLGFTRVQARENGKRHYFWRQKD